MPYRIDPNNPRAVQKKSGGRWTRKQLTKSPAAAKRAIRLLRGIEHGTLKPRKSK